MFTSGHKYKNPSIQNRLIFLSNLVFIYKNVNTPGNGCSSGQFRLHQNRLKINMKNAIKDIVRPSGDIQLYKFILFTIYRCS
jgi:hypothetical protein